MSTHEAGAEPSPMSLGDLSAHYLGLARRGLRYWPRGLALLLAVIIPGLWWAAKRPRVYTSVAVFEVGATEGSQLSPDERDRMLDQRAGQAYNSTAGALAVLDAERLYPELRGRVSRERQAQKFQSNFRWRVDGGAIHLGFTHNDPDVAERVVHRMILRFTDDRRSAVQEQARVALAANDAQLEQSGRSVSDHSEALEAFERANEQAINRIRARGGEAPLALTARRAMSPRTRMLHTRISAMEAQRIALRPTASQPPPTSEVLRAHEARASAAREHLAALRAQYTAQHPRVIAAEHELAQAEAQREAERARLRANARGELHENERTERLEAVERDLAAARADLARSEADDQTVDAGVQAQRQTALASLPEVEIQWTRLRSNLATSSGQYQSLLQQRYQRQAEIARIRVAGADPVRVIDAPSHPMDPDPPGRAKLAMIVTLLALTLGVGCSVLSGLLDPRIYDETDLARWGELAMLSAIPERHS